jgi:DUF971 family protein
MAGPGAGKGPLLPLLGADPNAPKDLHLVGRYALGVDWQDRHGSIYPFAFLRESCPCPECTGAAAGAAGTSTGEAAWPIEIKREPAALRIRWQNGHETVLAYRDLRRLCRCAACTGVHG